MKKNVVIISSSLRKDSNSEALAKAFMNGAIEGGNEVEMISLAGKKIEFCKGCLACQKLGKCVISDDTNEIVNKMLEADVLVFASPVYYYSISGQLKTMLDRAYPLFSLDYRFRDVYFLSCAAEDEEETVVGAKTAVQGWIDCFGKAKLSGVVFAGGVNSAGDIKGQPASMEAYEMGKQIQ